MLKGSTALVTGASRGIGRAIAVKFAQNGASVAVNYVNNKSAAEEVVEEIRNNGGEAFSVKADVSNYEECSSMIKTVTEAYGGLDILVNNAGVTSDGLLLRLKKEDWDRVIDTNLNGLFNCSKAALKPLLKSKRGSVINLSSVVGIIGNAGQCNYSAAKAGVIGFTKSLAREVAGKDIRVNAVAPGFIDTDMTSSLSDDIKEQLFAQIPMSRLGQSGEVADAVMFLASPLANYITGQVINVDGGMAM